jgi:hypothetical protein
VPAEAVDVAQLIATDITDGAHAAVHLQAGCGSGSSDFVDPDPYWESGSRIRIQGQEN